MKLTDEEKARIARAKRGSKWLGPKTRKLVFGAEDAGVPRPSKGPAAEPAGFYNGARVRRR